MTDPQSTLLIAKKINLYIGAMTLKIWGDLITEKKKLSFLYSDNGEPIDLIGPDNKVLCSNGNCKADLLGSIFFDSSFVQKIQNGQSKNLIFGFPGKLSTGEYSFVLQTPKNHTETISITSNGLESAYVWDVSEPCKDPAHHPGTCSAAKVSTNQNSSASFPNWLGSDISLCEKLPTICYKNQLVLGKFILSTPKNS